MAMTKRTAYRKRPYRRYYRRYRSVSNQYFPCRVEGVYTISYPVGDAGAPRFFDAAGNFNYVVTFATLFSNSQYYGSLVNMFGYYKVTGVRMEVQPNWSNSGAVIQQYPILLGFRTGSIAQMTYPELIADNNSLFLGVSPSKKYVSTMNSQGWGPTNTEQVVGAFSVASSDTSDRGHSPIWSCKLCVYILFKKSNI